MPLAPRTPYASSGSYILKQPPSAAGQMIPIKEWIKTEVDWGANDSKDRFGMVHKFQDIIRDGTHNVMCNNNLPSSTVRMDKHGQPVKKVVWERLEEFDVIHMEDNPKLTKGSKQSVNHMYQQHGMPVITNPYVPPNVCAVSTPAPVPVHAGAENPKIFPLSFAVIIMGIILRWIS